MAQITRMTEQIMAFWLSEYFKATESVPPIIINVLESQSTKHLKLSQLKSDRLSVTASSQVKLTNHR